MREPATESVDVTLAAGVEPRGSGAEEDRRARERGEAIGRYVVLDRLGQGGMGVVYAAYDPELDRKIALKLLHSDGDGSGQQGEDRRRIVREAQAMARLAHPHVIAVHDVGEHMGHVFLAMEFVDGVTLGKWIGQAPRRRAEILAVFGQAGEGLAAAHAKDLVHRDFKPDNVMVGADGRVRVMDFGLARSAAAESGVRRIAPDVRPTEDMLASELTAYGAVAGTPAYMAPEQHLGFDIDARTDQFSFCVALYEALYGTRPFAGDNLAALVLAVTNGTIRAPARDSDVPGWLRKVVVRGLARDPGERWPSMRALLDALARDPSRARRRRAGVAVVGMAAALVPALLFVQSSRREAACASEGDAIAQVWDEARSTDLRDRFVMTGAAHARETWERLVPWLDEYAATWREQRTAACMAETGEDDRRLAIECLEERRGELAALVAALAESSASTLHNAVPAATRLPLLGSCADPVWLARRLPPPADPATREQVAALRERLTATRALESAGRYDDAHASATAAVDSAVALGWAPALAEARYALALVLEKRGEYEPAEEALVGAFLTAEETSHDELAAAAAVELVYVVGYRRAHHDEGLLWGRQASAWLGRLDQAESRLAARLSNSLGAVHDLRGARDEALAELERGLAIGEALFGPTHIEIASSLNSIGIVQQYRGQLVEAIASHERALAIREQALGPGHPSVATSLANLANVERVRGASDRARELHERALAIREQALGPEHPDVATSHNNLGLVDFDARRLGPARFHFERALAIREKALGPDHPDVATALSNLGNLANEEGDHDTAQREQSRALAIREKAFGPDHPLVLAALGNLSIVHDSRGDHAQAIELQTRVLAARERKLAPDHIEVATSLESLSRMTWDDGELDRAIGYGERALAILEKQLLPGHERILRCLHRLGELEHQAGRLDRAATRFDEGLAKAGDNQLFRGRLLLGKASVQLAQRDRDAAIATLEQSLAALEKDGKSERDLAAVSFELAKALADRDRPRALELARRARDVWSAGTFEHAKERLAEAEAWLAKR